MRQFSLDRTPSMMGERFSDSIDAELALSRMAQVIRTCRKARRAEFGLRVSESAWDMLIELYIRESTGNSTTGAILKEAADVPPSTATRWLRYLIDEGFVRTRSHSTDPQTEFIEMTNSAREALERYFAKVQSVAAEHVGTTERSQLPKIGR